MDGWMDAASKSIGPIGGADRSRRRRVGRPERNALGGSPWESAASWRRLGRSRSTNEISETKKNQKIRQKSNNRRRRRLSRLTEYSEKSGKIPTNKTR